MRNSVGNGHQDKCPEPSSSLHLLLHGSHSLHHMFVPSSACLCPPHSLLNERHPTVAKYIRVGLCGLASINLFETKESLLQCVGFVYVTKHNNELAMGWNISTFSGLHCHEFCVFHILYNASLNYIKHAIEKLILNAVGHTFAHRGLSRCSLLALSNDDTKSIKREGISISQDIAGEGSILPLSFNAHLCACVCVHMCVACVAIVFKLHSHHTETRHLEYSAVAFCLWLRLHQILEILEQY